jgi:Flp pilus assembly protein TadG
MSASPATPGAPPPPTRPAGAGQTVVLVAVVLGVLIVVLGAVVSVSSTDAAYGQAQDAANAAALAGAQAVLLGRDDSAVTQAMVRALQAQGTFTTVTVTTTAPPVQAAPMTLWVQARYLDPAGQPSTSVSGWAPPSGASGVRVDAATLFAQPTLGALLGRSTVVLKTTALARRGPPPHLETP